MSVNTPAAGNSESFRRHDTPLGLHWLAFLLDQIVRIGLSPSWAASNRAGRSSDIVGTQADGLTADARIRFVDSNDSISRVCTIAGALSVRPRPHSTRR
jgi:hypothetical protein